MEVAERGDNLVHKGSVKAALSLFGEKLDDGNAKWKKTDLLHLEKERELSVAKMDGNKFNGRQQGAERVKSQAESKIFAANKMGETLNPQTQLIRTNIDREFQSVKDFIEQKGDEVLESDVYSPNNQYINEMKKELEFEKENIRNLKQNISYALQMKSKAERQANEAIAKAREYSISENILRNRIEEANEELVLVELAKIEATKELRQAEAEREANAALLLYKMAEAQNKIIELLHELSFSKDLETVLELTNSEIEVLQNELRFCKAMEEIEGKALKRTQSSLGELISRTEEEDLAASSKLASSITELDQAEKELKGLREEGFHVMTSMDIIRNELKQTSSETARWKGLKDQSESKAECLDSKLLKARKELEIATKAEENAKSIHYLLATLTQLRTETDAAKNEKQATDKEIQKIRSQMQATRIATNEAEQRLQAALQDLEKIKAAEMVALENLSILSEKIVMARSASSQRSLTITISSFEFEYLIARAQGADEIANKKVTAAKASVDTIRYSEREIIMKTESAEREIAELKMAQEQELDAIEKTLAEKKVLEAELNKWKMHDSKKQQLEEPLPNKHIREYGRTTSVRRTRAYRTPSPAHWNYARSPSFSMKKKKKMVIPSLVRLFSGKKFQKFPYRN